MESGHSYRYLAYLLITCLLFLGFYLLGSLFHTQHSTPAPSTSHHSQKSPEKPAGQKRPEPKFKKEVFLNPQFKDQKLADSLKSTVQAEEPKNIPEASIVDKPENILTESSVLPDDYFQQLQKQYNEKIMSTLAPGDIRRDIIIRYYTHAPDGDRVYDLRNLGFYIHERPVEGAMLEDYESNSVFYGDKVSKEDLQLVVFTLLQNGLPIKKIAKSRYHDDWKSAAIEIGTDTTISSRQVMSIEELKSFSP